MALRGCSERRGPRTFAKYGMEGYVRGWGEGSMGTDIITTKPKTAEEAAASASAAMAMDDDDSDSDEPGANLPPELRALIEENPTSLALSPVIRLVMTTMTMTMRSVRSATQTGGAGLLVG